MTLNRVLAIICAGKRQLLARSARHALLALAFLLAGCAPVPAAHALAPGAAVANAPAQSVAPQEEGPIQHLWMDLSMGPQLIDWFNQNARPDDIARADHISLIDMLEPVKVGRKLVIFKNIQDAEQLMPHIQDKIDIIGYNLEHGPSNRPNEQNDPVGSIRRMRALADEYGKELAFGPDRNFAISDGEAMAPYADIFVLQVQRVQTEPGTVREFVVPMVALLRRANPDIQISVQVRTDGDPEQIVSLLTMLEPQLDGISILTSAETMDIAQELVTLMRPAPAISTFPPSVAPGQEPSAESTPNAAASGAQADLPPAPTPTRRSASTPTPVPPMPTPAAPAAPPSDSGSFRFILLTGLIAFGVVFTGVLGTIFLYSLRKLQGK
jgi:hypothetical protein